jgi:hypothetical protein
MEPVLLPLFLLVNGQFEGVIPHLVDGGLSLLHYTDDTILYMEHDLEIGKKSEIDTFGF